MASSITGFEYDIFISYRQNDNRSGWVTEFAKALEEELAATVKEPLSIYFDRNPHDGLLETHQVSKSLEGKLVSLIFIPILSQTYCDQKSFAWQHEFCAFNKLATDDQLGRDIKLNSGNVASRILPIKIHDLDTDDQGTIEKEIGSVLRAVEFIYKEPGVNRPLKLTDHRHDNQNKTDYRNQINKVANAVKEITSALRHNGTKSAGPLLKEIFESSNPGGFNQTVVEEKSLAVIPLANLSQDPTQEYFADGITENILTQLASLPQLRVISRTSVMRYKKTVKSAPEIARELGVTHIVEGSVQVHGGRVRISAQLVDAVSDKHVWSRVFMENMDDIFALQDHVAQEVAKELSGSLHQDEAKSSVRATSNLDAYDLFLKGRHAFNQWNVEGYKTATEYFKKAIALDPDFKEAYSYLASSFSARMSWNGDLSPGEAQKNISIYLDEAWKRGPSDNDYLTKAYVELFVYKNFSEAEALLLKATALSSNNTGVLYAHCYLLCVTGRFQKAAEILAKAKSIDPLTVGYFNYQALTLHFLGRHEEALLTLKEGLQLYPSVLRFYDFLGRVYLTMRRYAEAAEAIQVGLHTTTIRPPSMVAYLAASYVHRGETAKAKEFLKELEVRSEADEKGVNYYIVHIYAALNDHSSAVRWLKKAQQTNDVDLIWYEADPLLNNLRNTNPVPDFDGAENHITQLLESKMPRLAYHNIEHIQDVLNAATTLAHEERLPEEETRLLRIAALMHDAGFIDSEKNHEERGTAMTRELLPHYGFRAEQIEVISNIIMATRWPQSPNTLVEKILCDADLDYLGRPDFYETGGKLFQELKQTGVVRNEQEWNLRQKQFLEQHRYHTAFSKANREAQKNERLKEIEKKLNPPS